MNEKKSGLTPLGKEIKKRIIDKGMTQTELAAAVGTSLKYLGHIIHGRKSGEKYIDKIADLLDIDISKFVA